MFFAHYYKTAMAHHRNWPIDLLRGILVLIGASGHFYYIMSYFGAETLHWTQFSALLAYNIPYGIAIFSPVSGFLITTMLLKHANNDLHTINIPQFYLQRFARIMPGLILLCLLNLILFKVNYPGFEINFFNWQTILTHVFTFRTNLLFPDRAYHLWAWSILWSLAIEEVFYLFFPIICVLLRSPKKIIVFLVCIIFYGPYCRLHAPSAFGSVRLYFGCFDLIAFGCLAALLSQTKLFIKESTQRFHPKMWIIMGTILMIGMYFIGPWTLNNVCGPTIIALGCFLYLIGVTYNQDEKDSIKESRLALFFKKLLLPFCLLGLLSYEFYLYHVMIFLLFKPLITWMGTKVGWTWFFSNTWMLGLEVLTGVLGWFWLFHFINPFRKKLVERFSPRLDFFTFVTVPRFFHALSQQCNYIYHRLKPFPIEK